MNYYRLEELVDDYRAGLNEWTVHYCCDCGCGGDFWSDHPDMWDDLWKRHYEAKEELIKMGVTFEHEDV